MNIVNVAFDTIADISKKDERAELSDEVIIYDNELMDGRLLVDMPPVRIEAMTFFLCRYGEISFSVDYKTYHLTKGSILTLNNRHILDHIHINSNYEGYAMVISEGLLQSIALETPGIKKMLTVVDHRPEPLMKLEDAEMRYLIDIMVRIKRNLKAADHAFQRQVVKNDVSNFILELANILLKRLGVDNDANTTKENRREEVTGKFIRMLLDHCKEQHEVAFYAEALCMTPGNLSRTITAISGKSPIKWISDTLVAEAKILLRRPDISIQQVSEELHFGDQSSFGKFFKKHTGHTPMEYKNKG